MMPTISRSEEALEHDVYMDIVLDKMRSSGDKKYKETKLKEIISVVCALLNTNGGKLQICFIESSPKQITLMIAKCVRMIEQRVTDMIGCSTMVSNIKFEKTDHDIVLGMKKSSTFISISYNLYLPNETQVVSIPSTESIEKVKEVILNRQSSKNEIQIGTHNKTFVIEQNCSFLECKSVQFKNIKASASKCITLADRIVGNSNKFVAYVSAFANHNGGHVYYGITEDGNVEGEIIPNENGMKEITRKVEKTINNMIWPEQLDKPQRGAQWDIFFQSVQDIHSNTIPSVYVIVIYIAPCLGGVFIDEPESYEIIDGELKKVSFTQWKLKLSSPDAALSSSKQEIPQVVKRCHWSSRETEITCIKVSGYLQTFINNGNWENFWRHTKIVESTLGSRVEVKLVVLSKKVTAFYRTASYKKASAELEKFRRILPKSKDVSIFEVIGLYLNAALERCRGNLKISGEILSEALRKVHLVPPGLITASVYSFGGTLCAIIDGCEFPKKRNEISSHALSIKALDHLESVHESTEMKVDMQQKTHINLALNNLGSSLSGDLVSEGVDKQSLEAANNHLKAVNETTLKEGYALSSFRQIQFELASSIMYYRRSQTEQGDKRQSLLRAAFNGSKRAENLARECQFDEMVRYAQTCKAVCTEGLVRTCKYNIRDNTTVTKDECVKTKDTIIV